MNQPRPSTPDLETLLSLFYESAAQLGTFREVTATEMPPLFAGLLAHEQHMTVTVESHHGSSVDVEVLETKVTPTHYSRKILLRRQSDRQVVQFGIVRLSLDVLAQEVRDEIEAENRPLGRILIDHDVLRHVRLVSLWHVTMGPDLAGWFESAPGESTYGRTALIYCNGEPAVELLEIVTAD